MQSIKKIAILGWGSLVWDPRTLAFQRTWFKDGPLLPIEFARISNDKRITLVIVCDQTPLVRSLWALSSLDSIEKAKENLATREGIKKEKIEMHLGVWDRDKRSADKKEDQILRAIDMWAINLNLDAVLWTNLKPKSPDKKERFPSFGELREHLSKKCSYEERSNAENYIRRTPRQIDTPYRRRFEIEYGWSPVE